jgi:DNA-directed RNA polymerase subunit F
MNTSPKFTTRAEALKNLDEVTRYEEERQQQLTEDGESGFTYNEQTGNHDGEESDALLESIARVKPAENDLMDAEIFEERADEASNA